LVLVLVLGPVLVLVLGPGWMAVRGKTPNSQHSSQSKLLRTVGRTNKRMLLCPHCHTQEKRRWMDLDPTPAVGPTGGEEGGSIWLMGVAVQVLLPSSELGARVGGALAAMSAVASSMGRQLQVMDRHSFAGGRVGFEQGAWWEW
jgi:hypothetical protein